LFAIVTTLGRHSPSISNLVESYARLLVGPHASLAGLWAYEGQGAESARSTAEGLVRHYGASQAATQFWTVHGWLEDSHAQWTLGALSLLDIDPAEAQFAARLIGDAWRSFLDERELLAA
jgi:pyrroloquinoline quinone (PQQ) biosynthesis protein C